MNNLSDVYRIGYVEVNSALAGNIFTIAGGAPGWIDTDISGSSVPAAARIIVLNCQPGANQNLGARANGDTVDRKINNAYTVPILTSQSTARHIDFYRAAADNTYTIRGYIL